MELTPARCSSCAAAGNVAVAAALVGLFAIRWLVVLVRRMELFRFAIYLCILVTVGVAWLLLA